MRYYTNTNISENIQETPEGYLVCLGVAIARTGVQEYLAEEIPDVAPGAQGTVLVYRLPKEVFAPATVASFEGKSVTIDHPEDFVTPENWRELTVGIVQNVRRGMKKAGEEGDLLLADIVITDAGAITAVRGGLRELSCGYDAGYEEISPGVGRQVGIIGNHVALVEQGRCGARCKIVDSNPKKETLMPSNKAKPAAKPAPGFLDRLFGNPKVRRAMDEAAAEATQKAAQDDDPAQEPKTDPQQATDNDDALAQLAAKVDELTLMVRSLAEGKAAAADTDPTADADPEDDDTTADADPEDDDPTADADPEADDPEKARAGDRALGKRASRKTADADTVRRARILAPALRARVGDSACTVKRAALRSCMADASVRKTVDACLRGSTLDSADCLTLDAAFIAASEVAGGKNNKRTADTLTRAHVRDFGKAVTPADINRMNREFHDKAKGK